MKELSIFIDESGDFGKFSEKSPFYIVSFVFHNQEYSIDEQINKLDNNLLEFNIPKHNIHTGPLIRRESLYRDLDLSKRFKIFNKLFYFTKNVNINYKSIIIDKKYTKSQLDITKNISKQLSLIIKENLEYFQGFDSIIVYYDNGQIQLANIIVAIFYSWFEDNFEYRIVAPQEYKLFQTADLVCTLTLLKHKIECNQNLTSSEKMFFGSCHQLKRNYLRKISNKEL